MACNSHFHYRLYTTGAYLHHFPSNQCPVSVRSLVHPFTPPPPPQAGSCQPIMMQEPERINHYLQPWLSLVLECVCCPPVNRTGSSITCFLANTKEICTSCWVLSRSYIIWILGHTSFTGIKRCHTWIHSPLPPLLTQFMFTCCKLS